MGVAVGQRVGVGVPALGGRVAVRVAVAVAVLLMVGDGAIPTVVSA